VPEGVLRFPPSTRCAHAARTLALEPVERVLASWASTPPIEHAAQPEDLAETAAAWRRAFASGSLSRRAATIPDRLRKRSSSSQARAHGLRPCTNSSACSSPPARQQRRLRLGRQDGALEERRQRRRSAVVERRQREGERSVCPFQPARRDKSPAGRADGENRSTTCPFEMVDEVEQTLSPVEIFATSTSGRRRFLRKKRRCRERLTAVTVRSGSAIPTRGSRCPAPIRRRHPRRQRSAAVCQRVPASRSREFRHVPSQSRRGPRDAFAVGERPSLAPVRQPARFR
jgi:hypothetical protein